jgi:uncharacterized protein (DUF433 family)
MNAPPESMEVAGAGPEIPTEHPHIARRAGICGGAPIIRGTRIPVRQIAVLYREGASIGEILETYPHLQASWVHDAISYYLDHQREIEQEIEENRIENVLKRTDGTMNAGGVIRFGQGKPVDEH